MKNRRTTAADVAKLALANGWSPIPIAGGEKFPAVRGWQRHCDEPPDVDQIDEWDASDLMGSVGLACGALGRACDIDVLEPDLARAIERLARKHLGDAPLRRVGRAPKILLVYRPASGSNLRKQTIKLPPLRDADGEVVLDDAGKPRGQRVELLGRGQQFVAFGTHPDTGKRYAWGEDGEGPSPISREGGALDDQPEIDDDAWAAFEEAVLALARMLYGPEAVAAASRTHQGEHEGDAAPATPMSCAEFDQASEDLREALLSRNNGTGKPWIENETRESWRDVGAALRLFAHECCPAERRGPDGEPLASVLESFFGLWTDWSRDPAGEGSGKYDPEDQEKTWASFRTGRAAGEQAVTVAGIFARAEEAGFENPARFRAREARAAERTRPQDDFAGLAVPKERQAADLEASGRNETATPSGKRRFRRRVIEMVPGELVEITDAAEAALLEAGQADPSLRIYQRGGALARPVRLDEETRDQVDAYARRADGSLTLVFVASPWLVLAMARSAEWATYDGRSKALKAADPRALYAMSLMARSGEWRFPVLRGVVGGPTIDRDGRLIQQPGYDRASGLLLDFEPGAFPTVPDAPTKAQAEAALRLLARPFRGFRYDRTAGNEGLSEAVLLSALLVAVHRAVMRTCPAHVFDAPAPGSGKTMLAQCVGMLATGVEPAAMSQGANEEESEKRLATVLAAGDPVILIDNCARRVGGDFLCAVLTSELVQARILGKSERVRIPSTALILLTGNNIALDNDAARRSVCCRVDSETERPDQRVFDFDPRDEVRRDRPALVAAALTILRAYHVAGRPDPESGPLRPFGSFQDYDLVRGALAWLGHADPAETRHALMEADVELEGLAELMAAWDHAHGSEPVALSKIDLACGALREKVIEVVGCPGGAWNSRMIGRWLARQKGRVLGGRRFARVRVGASGTTSWRLARVAGADAAKAARSGLLD